MKNILLMTFLSLGFLTTNLSAVITTEESRVESELDCKEICTKKYCSGPKINWDECFQGCWHKKESSFSRCKAGAKEAGNIDPNQRMIMNQFQGN